ncbi:Glutamine--fructose-6-phosphate aminotransferase [isomerizing] [Candidatus Calditenuaceae archaeon HR02]|nr:Glutamine--fructose-6-phosphate aminotransferase [isomerizing] [Candidatus Calditenuaceae archaeon HR02]
MTASHYMIREIREGPAAFRETLEALSVMGVPSDEIGARYRRIITCSSGSSHHAGLCLSYAASRIAGIEAYSVHASEYSEHVHNFLQRGHLLVAISQSGESVDTVRAARLASAKGVDVLALTSVPDSTLGSLARYVVVVKCGVERAIPATKSFMAQLAAVYSLAFGLAPARLVADSLREDLSKLPGLLGQTIDRSEELMQRQAKKLASVRHAFILGYGPSYIAALEASLKLKETCGIHAEAYSIGEFRHGPISLLDSDVACMFITPPEPGDYLDVFEKVATEALSSGSQIMMLSHEGGGLGADVTLPRISHVLATAVEVVPFQLLAYYTAVEKGLDPDRPRRLRKVVQ